MRIAIVTEVWRPSINGVVTRLAATVDELVRNGHQVLIIAPRLRGSDVPPPQGVQLLLVPSVGIKFIYGGQPWGLPLPRAAREIRRFRPDLVHVVNPVLLGIAGVIAARRRRVPLVCSYHTNLIAYAGSYHLGWLRPVIGWLLRRLHGAATINLVTSEAGRQQLLAVGLSETDGRCRIEMWPRGVDLRTYAPGDYHLNGSHGLARNGDDVRVLYVGRLAEEKNLAALKDLASLPAYQLVLVGDGPARHALTTQLPAGVVFTGVLHSEELAAAYRSADVFVFPSTTETLGLVILEALAVGLPVIAADSPASRELLDGCPAARLWNPGNGQHVTTVIEELLGSAPREELSKRARDHVADATWTVATERLLRFYDEACNGTGSVSHGGSDGDPGGMDKHPGGSDNHQGYNDHPLSTDKPQRRKVRRDQIFRQVARFSVVGATNAAVDLGLFNLLLFAYPTRNTPILVLFNTCAVLAALTNSWWWNSRWTFRRRKRIHDRRRQRLLFAAQGAVNIGVNDATVAAVSAALNYVGVLGAAAAGNVAKVIAMVVASATSFVAMHLVVFRSHHHKEHGPYATSDR